MSKICRIILRLFGWKVAGQMPEECKKCVLVMIPHTSNWDYVIGKLASTASKAKPRILIKKDFFFFPVGLLLRALGSVPVDRNKNNNIIKFAKELFQKHDKLALSVTPEGTRSLNHKWRKGFYFIALKSGVPIQLTFIDYKKKIAGFGPFFYPSGNYDKDLLMMEAFYKNVNAKFPEKFNLSRKGK